VLRLAHDESHAEHKFSKVSVLRNLYIMYIYIMYIYIYIYYIYIYI
jgi:hypothetical protein